MIRPVVKDIILLKQKSVPASKEDMPAADDLRDTLAANSDRCVGMAANMIGVNKRIIISADAGIMFNPVITKKSKPYETEEGCLSLEGVRRTKRYMYIEVEYTDAAMKKKRKKFSGRTAQIIQHECDHLDGIII